MSSEPHEVHNTTVPDILRILLSSSAEESERWVLLESLCLAVGHLHGRTPKQTAEFVDIIAQRIASGERRVNQGRVG